MRTAVRAQNSNDLSSALIGSKSIRDVTRPRIYILLLSPRRPDAAQIRESNYQGIPWSLERLCSFINKPDYVEFKVWEHMMACDTQAGLEAQKLISISLGKMAASRVGRTGTSLHKSLLVASVLHRARHVFLEESYHVHRIAHPEACPQPLSEIPAPPLIAVYTPLLPPPPPTSPAEDTVDSENKENQTRELPPQLEQLAGDSVRMPLSESNCVGNKTRVAALKRRRCVSQQETQEAVWSILPKRPRTSPTESSEQQQDIGNTTSMEVEHITSLVSIFSFGGQRVDLCGTEAAREDVAQFQPVALAV